MKKFFKIFGIVIASIVAFFIVVSIIVSIVVSTMLDPIIKKEGAKYINATFDYKKLNVSLFRNFPSVSLSIKDFYIEGIDEFDKIRLVEAGEVTAAVNLWSVLSKDGYEISKVILKDIYANAIVTEAGSVNWDILKPSEKEEQPEEEKSEGNFLSTLKIKLKKISLQNINAVYDDKKNAINVDLKKFDAFIKGDFSMDSTVLSLNTDIDSLSVKMKNIGLLTNANIGIDALLDADLKNLKFGFKESNFRLNSIKAEFVGWGQLLKDKIDLELALLTNEIEFKDLLSLIPKAYTGSLDGITTNGKVSLKASAKGAIKGDSYPAFDLGLKVKDANFKYSSLPASVDKINLNLTATSLGGSLDNVVATIAPLSFSVENNPFVLNASVKSPLSDLDFSVATKGFVDLKRIVPVKDLKWTGSVNTDLSVAGKMSYIEKGDYDKIKAKGFLQVANMVVNFKGLPEIDLKKATLNFSSKYLSLVDTYLLVEDSDIELTSKFENYLAYIFKKKTIKGNLNIKSKNLNIDKILLAMKDDESEKKVEKKQKSTEKSTEKKSESKVIVVPKNISFDANLNIANMLFQNIEMKNILGKLIINNGTVDMNKVSVDVFDGKVAVNGKYSTAKSEINPDVNAVLNLQDVSIIKICESVKFVNSIVPLAKDLKGSLSSDINLSTKLNSNFSPVLKTMNGSGVVKTSKLDISKLSILKVIGSLSKRDEFTNFSTPNLNINFTIKNGKIVTKPFDIKIGTSVLSLSGSSTLDQNIDYLGSIKTATGVEIPLIINGSFSDPKVKLDAAKSAKKVTETIITKGLEELTGKKETTGDSKDNVKDAASKLFNALKKR